MVASSKINIAGAEMEVAVWETLNVNKNWLFKEWTTGFILLGFDMLLYFFQTMKQNWSWEYVEYRNLEKLPLLLLFEIVTLLSTGVIDHRWMCVYEDKSIPITS